MNRLRPFLGIGLCSTIILVNASGQMINRRVTPNQTATYLSYNPSTSGFDLKQSILYQLPDPALFGRGPYPVFVWTPGTWEAYFDPLSLEFVSEMAHRGFLAASVQYSNSGMTQNCTSYTQRAQGVYDATRSSSAVGTLCALSGANCAKGIVTAGISQGGMLAVLARNYAPQVRAAYALSVGDLSGGAPNLTACMDKQHTAIPADRLTVVTGQSDPFFGTQTNVQNVSGYACPDGSTQCWSPTGSGAGWYLVQDYEVTDGNADHCYIDVGGCNDKFDPHWFPPAVSNWSLSPNLDWLATLGTKRVFSQTGQ